jgi:hypothetical protein
MDTISVRLLEFETCKQYASLMELQVSDLKLAKVKQETIIFNLKEQVKNLGIMVDAYEQMEIEYEAILGSERASCKVEKKRIRKRLLLLGGSGTIGGIVLGLVIGIIAN